MTQTAPAATAASRFGSSSGPMGDYQLPQLKDAVRETESRVIRQAIQKYGDTKEGKKLAAQALGISLATLYNKLR